MAAAPAIARFRLILWTLVVIVAIGATALFIAKQSGWFGRSLQIGVTGAPFTLESTAGGTFTQDNLKGTPSLVFFGYTFCPDVCPTTMAESVEWRNELGLKPDELRTIFVTVDPARDTKAALTEYLGAFDPSIIGLVGTSEQTETAKAAFGVMSENKAPDANGNYVVNHTALVFLIGKNGAFEGTIAYGEDKASAVAKIKRLIGA